MFAGEMTAGAAERLKKHGFALIEEKNAAAGCSGRMTTRACLCGHVFSEMDNDPRHDL
jgi:hypothetical protein